MSRRKAASTHSRALPPFEVSHQPWFGPTKRVGNACGSEAGSSSQRPR